jgi:hypothetical protein
MRRGVSAAEPAYPVCVGEVGAKAATTNNNKANGDTKDVETCQIFARTIRKRGAISAELWLEQRFNNNTGARKPGRNNRGKKYTDRLKMFVLKKHDTDVMT